MLPVVNKICILIFAAVAIGGCASQSSKDNTSTEPRDVVRGPIQYIEAVDAAKNGDHLKAIGLLQKVTRDHPEFSVAYTDLGLQYLQTNKLDAAEKAFEKSIDLDPSDFVAYNHLGVVMRKRGNFAVARDMYLVSIGQNGQYANAHLNIAVLFDIYLYDLDQALEYYRKYQSLTNNGDKLVAKWVVDLERRIAVNARKKK